MHAQATWLSPVDCDLPVPDSDDALNDEITRLAGHINAATYRFLKLLAIQIERNGWAGAGIKSPAHWLNYRCGIALGAAREKVRVALRLNELPQIDAAFRTGALSYSKVRAMTRVATAENEEFLLQVARYGTASHMERLVRKYERAERRLSPDYAMTIQDARSLDWYHDDDGMLVIEARLPPEEGAKVVQAILALVQETFPRQRVGEDEPAGEEAAVPAEEDDPAEMRVVAEKDVSAETCAAQEDDSAEMQVVAEKDVSAETCAAEEKNVSAETSVAEWREESTHPQKRADALVRMAEHLVATRDRCRSNPKVSQIMVHIDANSARQAMMGEGGAADVHCYLDGGPFLSPQTVRRLACDAGIVPLLENGEGQLLSIGRKSRVVPAPMMRALKARDGGCRYPGCTVSHFAEAHHIVHWCDGGKTCLDNLVLLCKHHHRLHHEGNYRIVCTEDGDIAFIGAQNRVIPPALYPQFDSPGDATGEHLAIELEHEALGLEIDALTAVTRWRGEQMDYGDAVGALWGFRQVGDVESAAARSW